MNTKIERHCQVNAEGCKPEIGIQAAGNPTPGSTPVHGLDKAEGCKPDLNNSLSGREVSHAD